MLPNSQAAEPAGNLAPCAGHLFDSTFVSSTCLQGGAASRQPFSPAPLPVQGRVTLVELKGCRFQLSSLQSTASLIYNQSFESFLAQIYN